MARLEKSAGSIIYYLNKESKPVFLFLQNTLKTTYLEVPKGKIEGDESVEETAKREVAEETGLNHLKIIPGFKYDLQWFFRLKGEIIKKQAVYLLAKISENEKDNVRISKEHQEFFWLDFTQAMEKIKISANREMIKYANDFILRFEKQKTLS